MGRERTRLWGECKGVSRSFAREDKAGVEGCVSLN